MAETPKKETIEVVLKNWRAEVETAQVYRDLAARESDERRKGILVRMAEAEERHARRWEQKLRDMGEPVPTLTDNIWTRFKRRFTRSLGTDIAIRRMEAAEEKHEREFSAQRDRALAGEQEDRKSTRLNSSHVSISYAVFCLKKKKKKINSNKRHEKHSSPNGTKDDL